MRLPHALLLCGCCLIAVGCKDCETDTRYFNAVREMIVYPERFQAYIDAHRSEFDARFFECGTECVATLGNVIAAEEEKCDETFSDPDFLRGCYDDLQPIRFVRGGADGVRLVLQSSVPFEDTDMYWALDQLKSPNPALYVQTYGGIVDLLGGYMNCRRCSRSFLGIRF